MLDPEKIRPYITGLLLAIEDKDVAAPLVGVTAGLIDGCVSLSAEVDRLRGMEGELRHERGQRRTFEAQLGQWQESFRDVVHQRDRMERERDQARKLTAKMVERAVHFCRDHTQPGRCVVWVTGLGQAFEHEIPADLSEADYERLKLELRAEVLARFAAEAGVQ